MPGTPRRPKSKKGPSAGTGGYGRKKLEGKGPTPRAEERPHHPAARRAKSAAKSGAARSGGGTRQNKPANRDSTEVLVGRNPVVEALRAGVPATALYVAQGLDLDDRVTESIRIAGDRGIAILEVSRHELDRMTGGALHQGLGIQVPPYSYAHPDDVLADALDSGRAPLVVALDGLTDPRNLGAVVRSAAAFGAHAVLLPERRSATMTATAWRTSAGTAARLPVARVTNLVRTLTAYRKAGLTVVGLAAAGVVTLDDLEVAVDPLVLVIGSEGRGLSRLVGETCDLTVSIPMFGAAESLNASVAAAVALAEVARRRRLAG
ncbi:MAG: 23S rRNA (guanosine(2251)-2'-O)-methyltransferase RlmB [Pseudonocardiales bacterium]|nr:MAG: 23S rRNA (guanosine(2251)-2'-O)-methyltransferase RlmB [Pseudonocardiales bacterium]